jgi:hypothetical protein
MDKVRAPWRWSVSDDRKCVVAYDAEDRAVAWFLDDDVADHVCGLVNLDHVRSAMPDHDPFDILCAVNRGEATKSDAICPRCRPERGLISKGANDG